MVKSKKFLPVYAFLLYISTAAAQFGSDLGGRTLQQSFVNFFDTITLVNIYDVPSGILFLVVVAMFYYAELNILEQVFLRIEELIKEGMSGDDYTTLYGNDEGYPTGVKGMALAIAFLTANGIGGLFGLYAAITMGVMGVLTVLVMHGKILGAVRDTRMNPPGGGYNGGQGAPTAPPPNQGGGAGGQGGQGGNNGNQNARLSEQDIRFIMQTLRNQEPVIERMEDIEEDQLNRIRNFNQQIEQEIERAERKLETMQDSLESTLTRTGAPNGRLENYFEDPESLVDDIGNRFNPSLTNRQRDSLRTSKENIEELVEELEEDRRISNEADRALNRIQNENQQLLQRFEGQIIHYIENEVNYSNDIEDILIAFTDVGTWRRAGVDPQTDAGQQAIELAEHLKEQYERHQEIRKAEDRMENIVEGDIIPELNELINVAERQIEIIDVLLGNNNGNGGGGGNGDEDDNGGNGPRRVIIPNQIAGEIRELANKYEEEVIGTLIYRQDGRNLIVVDYHLTGMGSTENGHEQAEVDRNRFGPVYRWTQDHDDYGFVEFHTHTRKTAEEMGDVNLREWSDEDENMIRNRMNDHRFPGYIGMLFTPAEILIAGEGDPDYEIVDPGNIPSFGQYRNRMRLDTDVQGIADQLTPYNGGGHG